MDIKELVEKQSPWYVWVLEYGITHGVMRLALHHGDYPAHCELICGGTEFFSGPLQGGLYELMYESAQDSTNETTHSVIRDKTNCLVIRFERITIGRTRM